MQLAIGTIELAMGRFLYAIKFWERDQHQLIRGMGEGFTPCFHEPAYLPKTLVQLEDLLWCEHHKHTPRQFERMGG